MSPHCFNFAYNLDESESAPPLQSRRPTRQREADEGGHTRRAERDVLVFRVRRVFFFFFWTQRKSGTARS